jgi:hypothetical protein
MAQENNDNAPEPSRNDEPAADLAIPAERRSAAKAHAACLSSSPPAFPTCSG